MAKALPIKVEVDLDAKIKELKDVTREANEAVQALREARKEFEAVMSTASLAIQADADGVIAATVGEGLKKYESTLEGAIEDAEKAMHERFDTIQAVLLGEDRKGKKRGASIPDMILRMPIRTCCQGRHVSNQCPYGGIPGSREGDL